MSLSYVLTFILLIILMVVCIFVYKTVYNTRTDTKIHRLQTNIRGGKRRKHSNHVNRNTHNTYNTSNTHTKDIKIDIVDNVKAIKTDTTDINNTGDITNNTGDINNTGNIDTSNIKVTHNEKQEITNWPKPVFISENAIDDCMKIINGNKQDYFAPLYVDDGILEDLKNINLKYGTNISLESLKSMKNMHSGLLSRQNAFKIKHNKMKVISDYQFNNKSIIELSQTYRIPPMIIYRVLIDDHIINNDQSTKEKILKAIENYDISSPKISTLIRINSQECEKNLYKKLDDLGIKYTSEAELMARKSPFTPDVLFETPTTLNGKEIHWIDVKGYILTDSELNRESLQRQVDKYTTAFGPGAVMFIGGIKENSTTFEGKDVTFL